MIVRRAYDRCVERLGQPLIGREPPRGPEGHDVSTERAAVDVIKTAVMKRVWVLVALATTMGLAAPTIAVAAGSPPNAPTDLHSDDGTETSATVTWSPSTSADVTGYEAFVGFPTSYTQSTSVDGSTTSATFGNLQCGTSYWFSVVAVDSSGEVSPASTAAVSTAPCQADIQVVSDTPSVTEATIGQDVTFTIVATNNGPDAVGMLINTESTLVGLALPPDPTDSVDRLACQGVSNDGSACEYDWVQPGQTFTETLVLQTQPSSNGCASEVACAYAPWEQTVDAQFNDCAVATVKLDQESAGGGSGGGDSGGGDAAGSGGGVVTGSGGGVVAGSSGSQPKPQPRPQPPAESRPRLRVCVDRKSVV